MNRIMKVLLSTFIATMFPVCVFEGLFSRSALAWSVPTHEQISLIAANASVLNKGAVLGLGFVNPNPQKPDTEIKINDRRIGLWIQDGAKFEDGGNIFTGRFYNHFHNPLESTPSAGLSDIRSGQSALLWAQDPLRNADWSWQTVWQLYYDAPDGSNENGPGF